MEPAPTRTDAVPTQTEDAFLGVEASLSGRTWQVRAFNERLAAAISQAHDLPEIIGRVLAARGVTPEGTLDYLNPSLRHDLPDPSSLLDMDTAATRIADAIEAGEEVAVFGDYDVDGATSSALLLRFFRSVGGRLRPYIPDRLKEGYGPNTEALLGLKAAGVSLVITVDCGTLSFQPLAAAADAGLEVIVIDHHKAETEHPKTVALVNPNRLDESDDAPRQMAAVGVAFLLVVAINRQLRDRGWYGDSRPAPDLLAWLDVVALGTVCDVVPMTGVNRALVAQGLKVMAGRGNAGLRALADVAGMDEAPGTYHAGFLLGPRVNAGGRVGEAGLGTTLLSTDDAAEATDIAKRLDEYNRARQEIEAAVQEEAIYAVEAEAGIGGEPGPIICVAGEGWHAGVVGIVASRLKERYQRPAVVIAIDGDVAKGSARSIAGADIGAAMIEALHKGLLVNGGGHAMAAGLTADAARLDGLRTFLEEYLAADVAKARAHNAYSIEGVLTIGGANAELIETVQKAGPFGPGNAEPRFALPDLYIVNCDVVGKGHVRLVLSSPGGGRLKAIAFRQADQDLGRALLGGIGRTVHVAGRLKKDDWRGGDAVEMLLEDAAFVD